MNAPQTNEIQPRDNKWRGGKIERSGDPDDMVFITVRMPRSFRRIIKEAARKDRQSVNSFCLESIKAMIEAIRENG